MSTPLCWNVESGVSATRFVGQILENDLNRKAIYIPYLVGCFLIGALALFTGYSLVWGAQITPASFLQMLFSNGSIVWLAISAVNIVVLLAYVGLKIDIRKPVQIASFVVVTFGVSLAISSYVAKASGLAA